MLICSNDRLSVTYTVIRDPDGNVLVNDDETLMAAWYELMLIWDVPDP